MVVFENDGDLQRVALAHLKGYICYFLLWYTEQKYIYYYYYEIVGDFFHLRLKINSKYLINYLSSLVVAVIGERVYVAAESALEHVFGFYFHPLRAFAYLVSNLGTVIANVILWICLGKLFKEFFGSLEIFFNKYFWMIVSAFGSLFAIPVHIVPAKFTHNVFVLTTFPLETESHIKVRTALINVPVWTVLSSLTFLFHEIGADLEVMTEITLVSVTTLSQTFELVTWFDFAFIVGVRAVIWESALAVDELFTDSICSKFVMVSWGWCSFIIGCVIGSIISARICVYVVLGVHCN